MIIYLALIGFVRSDVDLKRYNLKNIAQPADKPWQLKIDDDFNVTYNFRIPIPKTEWCQREDCLVAVRYHEGECECYGATGNEELNPIENNDGVSFKYNGGEQTSHLTSVIYLRCDKKNTEHSAKKDRAQLFITIPSKYGCKLPQPLGWGWIFIFVLLGAAVLFILIGIPIQCIRGKRGLDAIPFYLFWVSIPRMVSTGFKVVFAPCCQKKSGFNELD
ncbi:hypothetical protein BLNAU_18396 [Blattamonas nauphoetae]|uniref:Autophagy-related protein 27 n=1 Tax=Blattamonas nauphoetae TaxID=2049346 RepID=A0ABQ9X5P3_9EUKA|nr:hypothetical protein BLNAU_18396 [Blattamonas nauphoetae]